LCKVISKSIAGFIFTSYHQYQPATATHSSAVTIDVTNKSATANTQVYI